MAVTANYYGKFFLSALNKEADLNSDTLKVMLLEPGHTPDLDGDQYVSDIVADEVTGTGYTAGGATIATPTVTYDAGTNTIKIDGGDASWPTSTIDAGFAAVYDSTPGSDATRPLILLINFDGTVSSLAGTFLVSFNAAGIATITVA